MIVFIGKESNEKMRVAYIVTETVFSSLLRRMRDKKYKNSLDVFSYLHSLSTFLNDQWLTKQATTSL